MLTAIGCKGLLIEQSGLKEVPSASGATALFPFSLNPAYEAEAEEAFILFCMDKERPTEWTATSENFMPDVRLIGDPLIN